MRGWTVTVWIDAPDDWNAERVREEIDAVFRGETRYDEPVTGEPIGWFPGAEDNAHGVPYYGYNEDSPITLNTVYTPRRQNRHD